MVTKAVLLGTELRLTPCQRASATTPATLSVQLTGRIFHTLHVQLAGADRLDISDVGAGRGYPLDTRPVALNSLAEAVNVRLDWSGRSAWPAVGVDLDMIVDDGDPAGPFTVTHHVGELLFTPEDRTATAVVALDSLRRRGEAQQ
jgi:hypothetical protein